MALGLTESCTLSQGFSPRWTVKPHNRMCMAVELFLNNIFFLLSILAFSRKIKVALNQLTLFAQNSIVPVGLMLVSDQDGIGRMNYVRTSSGYVLIRCHLHLGGFPAGSDGKASACNEGDPGSIPGLGRCPGEGNGNPLQCSCLFLP